MSTEVVVVAQPAAGVEPFIIVPAGEVWEVSSAKSFLITDATDAVREVRFIVDNPAASGTYTFVPSNVLQGPSESRTYQFGNYGYRGAGAINVGVVVGVGKVVLPGGVRLRLSTTNLQAADQWKELFLIVKKSK